MPRISLPPLLRRWGFPAIATIIIVLALWTGLRMRPAPEHRLRHSAATVRCEVYYEIQAQKQTLCFFRSAQDSVLLGLSLTADSAKATTWTAGLWMDRFAVVSSCHGRLVTTLADTTHSMQASPLAILQAQLPQLRDELKGLNHERKELLYYLRVHAVSDLGYGMVAAYSSKLNQRREIVSELISKIGSLNDSTDLKVVKHRSFTVYYRNLENKLRSQQLRTRAVSDDGRLILLQTRNLITPLGTEAARMTPWQVHADSALAVGFGGLSVPAFAQADSKPIIVPVASKDLRLTAPAILVPDGSGIYTERGRFIGISYGRDIIPMRQIHQLFRKEARL